VSANSGQIDAGEHRFPVRVYYEDTDAAGIVYHSRYLNFAERARTEMLRLTGLEQSDLRESHGVVFAVLDCRVRFIGPARFDDLLEVRSRLTELRGASLGAVQEIWRDDQRLVSLDLRVATVSSNDGRPARIPETVRAALGPHVQ
jgi:acyl-CoA thioester hydrolase